jgi:hypothetical protein
MTLRGDEVRLREHEHPIAADVRLLSDRLMGGSGSAPSFPIPQPDGLDEARAQRRELYVLAAVCARQVVEDFIAATPPSEVPRVKREPASGASAAFNDMLLATFEAFFEGHPDRWRDGVRTSPIAPLLARIDQIGPRSSGVIDTPRFQYAESLLQAGMRSMAPVAPGVLSAIIDLAAEAGLSTAPENVARIAHRSGRVASQLAALDLGRSREVLRLLIDDRTLEFRIPDSTRLTTSPQRERLELDLELPALTTAASRWPLPAAYRHAIGCPALVRVGSVAPLERLWTWAVDAAEQSGYLAVRAM